MEAREHVKESERMNASVMISLSILDHLETSDSASLTELAEALGVNKSRVLRLCGTMEEMGYVRRRQEDARYVLGPRVLSLGKAFERQNPIIRAIREQMRKVASELDENLLFNVQRDEKCLTVVSITREKRVRYVSPEGAESKVAYGAAGKVFLAFGPPEVRARVLASAPYPRYTEHTRTSAEELLSDIRETASRGYALSSEERTYGSAALAVPVYAGEGELLGALSIASTTSRLTPDLIGHALPLLRAAAAEIEAIAAGAEKLVPVRLRKDF